MSRDYSTRSRSRSRERQGTVLTRTKQDGPRDGGEEMSGGQAADRVEGSSWTDRFQASHSHSRVTEDDLAAEYGYSAPKRGNISSGLGSSLGDWATQSRSSIPQPPPPPPHPVVASSESEQWGYNPKPYVPQALPLNLPLLSNPVIQAVPPPPPTALPSGAHIVLENVPGDLNIMPLLLDHFKQFGDVLSIHCIPKYNKALIDFKTRQAAETAARQQVLGVPSITANVYGGPARGIGRGSVPRSQPRQSSVPGGLTKNLVLESDGARKARERRELQAAADKKRIEILSAYTEHVKQIVAKLADKTVKDEARAKYQEMLDSVKAKINDLQRVDAERRRKEQEINQKALAIRYKAYEKQARLDSSKKQQELTLDLRSRCVKISDLPEELSQSIVLVEYLRAMGMKDLNDVIWLDQRTAGVLRFASHAAAEQLVKHELAFTAEWVSNDEALNLSNFNPVEKVEILPLDDEDESLLAQTTEQSHS